MRELLPHGRPLRILDAGCGAGVMVARLRSRGSVTGIDFSGPAIELARGLVPDATFHVGDVTALDVHERFDAVCAFDVLEHIPSADRPGVLRALRERLEDQGLLILSTPHPGHIRHMRATRPELLQIVDEEVELGELIVQLEELGLELAHYRTYDIEFPGQYQLAVFRAPPDRQGPAAMDRGLQRRIWLTTNVVARPVRRAAAALHAWRHGAPEGAKLLLRARPPAVRVATERRDGDVQPEER